MLIRSIKANTVIFFFLHASFTTDAVVHYTVSDNFFGKRPSFCVHIVNALNSMLHFCYMHTPPPPWLCTAYILCNRTNTLCLPLWINTFVSSFCFPSTLKYLMCLNWYHAVKSILTLIYMYQWIINLHVY